MRSDAANLLERLGRRDFHYREFTDSFADMELWPIFEALLTDERIVGKPRSALAARTSIADVTPVPPTPRQGEESLFSRYATQPPATPGTSRPDLGSFLRRLSSNDAGDA